LTNQVPQRKVGPVFIAYFDEALMPTYQKIARDLRSEGIETEIYYGFNKGFRKMKKQMSYADDKNCSFAILIGENEAEKGIATVKNLKLGKEIASTVTDKKEWNAMVQKEIPLAELMEYIKNEVRP